MFSPPLNPASRLPKASERHWLGMMPLAYRAYYLAQAVATHPKNLWVYIAHHPMEAEKLANELEALSVTHAVLPDWETLVYDQLSAHQDIISERLALLTNMPQTGVLIVAAKTAIQRIAPPSWLLGQSFNLAVGEQFLIEPQRERLVKAGYRAVDTVYEPGEFAIRGSLIDVFPMGQPFPIRIDLFDQDIETLKYFDVDSQRTTQSIQQFVMLPAKEFPLYEGRNLFKARYAETFPNTPLNQAVVYQEAGQGRAIAGLEYYLPLYFEADDINQHGHLFSYLPSQAVIVVDEQSLHELQIYRDEIATRYEDRRHHKTAPILSPEQLFLTDAQWGQCLKQFPVVSVSEQPAPERAGAHNLNLPLFPSLTIQAQHSTPASQLQVFLQHFDGSVLVVAESAGRREIVREVLSNIGFSPKAFDNVSSFLDKPSALGLTVAPLDRGVLFNNLAIISEAQLYEHRVIQSRRNKRNKDGNVPSEFILKSLTDISVGAPVVHIDHGIGRYAGLVMLDIAGESNEFMQIDYAEDGKIYVPVTHLHLVSRYSGGDPEQAPLHRLGTDKWSKEKTKALEKIHDTAAELLDIEARRHSVATKGMMLDEQAYQQFAQSFPFEETPDQALAIQSTLHDMQANKPMDRLVCGDVGFGKTEVAMRAAFAAVMGGKQVAVLVPTTLLAQQHYENFCDRFADWPIKISVLSRFASGKQQNTAIDQLADGQVDIVIGTHKLLQADIKFKALGLMIVDEEHRFGVRDKERIKAMRAQVDMLTLTATPIPRTLNMAFSGLRDLSIISTPPARRLSVKTFVMEHSQATVKEALLRELLRGGQAYFLHNNVDTIQQTAEWISNLIPEARVGIAHGQMRERALEKVTQQFYHKDFNVLVCTTIIETGIDVPSANTIIIDRADKLGLAQLHQLRGRVGRSHHQAYAYMLVPSIKGLKGDAEKRLEAIERASHLGSGFVLASEDLEIRGAGEILGDEQSGHINRIGFSLYMSMLERATKALRQGKQINLDSPLHLTSELSLGIPAIIPDAYIGDVHHRLIFYKRIAATEDKDSLMDIRTEMIDRFGALPTQTGYLFKVHELRHIAERLGIKSVVMHTNGGTIDFEPDTKVEAITIIQLLQKHSRFYKMEGGQRLKITMALPDPETKLSCLADTLVYLEGR